MLQVSIVSRKEKKKENENRSEAMHRSEKFAFHGGAHSGQAVVLTRAIISFFFYSYALAEFWVQASGSDWLTPDTRPWCRTTVSRQLTRCCSPPDA